MKSSAKLAARTFDPEEVREFDSDHDHRLWMLSKMFDQASRGEDTAWALSNAFATVEAHFRHLNSAPLTSRERDVLLFDLARAQLGAIRYLPQGYPREQIDAGMKALATLVMIWAEAPERTAERAEHFVVDTCAYARMFRNDLHSMSLLDEIKYRAWQRRERKVQELLHSS
jgi:hypothetical protein